MDEQEEIKNQGSRFQKGQSGNPENLYSQQNQPSPEKKSQGWKNRRFKRDVIEEFLNTPYKFTKDSQIQQQLVKAFGKGIKKMPVGMIMILQQAQRAILKGDTIAFTALMDQAFGKLPQQLDIDADINSDSPAVYIGFEKVDQS